MSAANAKAANNLPADAFFISATSDRSLYKPKGWNMTSNASHDYVNLVTAQAQSFGGFTTFQVPTNLAQYIGKVILSFNINLGVTPGGALPYTGASAWWDDFLTIACIQRIELVYGSNQVQVLQGEELLTMYYNQLFDQQERRAFRDDLNGPLPHAVRVARMQQNPNSQLLFCRLSVPLYFTHTSHVFQPQTLGTYQTINVYWRPLSELRGSTGDGAFVYTTLPSIQDQQLRAEVIYVEQTEAAGLVSMTASDSGLLTLMRFAQVVYPNAPSINNGQTLPIDLTMTGLNAPTQTVAILLRNAVDLNTPDQVSRWNFRGFKGDTLRILTIELVVSGGNVRTIFSATENLYDEDQNRFNHFPLLGPIYFLDFAKHASGLTKTSGQIDIGGLANPILRVTVVNNTGAVFTPNFQLLAWTHNMANLKQGVLSRVFQ